MKYLKQVEEWKKDVEQTGKNKILFDNPALIQMQRDYLNYQFQNLKLSLSLKAASKSVVNNCLKQNQSTIISKKIKDMKYNSHYYEKMIKKMNQNTNENLQTFGNPSLMKSQYTENDSSIQNFLTAKKMKEELEKKLESISKIVNENENRLKLENKLKKYESTIKRSG